MAASLAFQPRPPGWITSDAEGGAGLSASGVSPGVLASGEVSRAPGFFASSAYTQPKDGQESQRSETESFFQEFLEHHRALRRNLG